MLPTDRKRPPRHRSRPQDPRRLRRGRAPVEAALAACTLLALVGCGGEEFTSSDSAASAGGAGSGGTTAAGAGAAGGDGDAGAGAGASGASGPCAGANDVCVPPAPSGWSGPAAFYSGGSEAPPACPADWPNAEEDAFSGVGPAAIECSACSCQQPAGGACSPPTITTYQGGSCSVALNTLTLKDSGACTPLPQASGAIELSPPDLTLGTCAAVGGSATTDEPLWERRVRLCGGGGPTAPCGGGGVCAAPPPAPWSQLCIWREGDQACPAGYDAEEPLFQGFTDTRGCSACACAAPTGATCAGSVTATNGPAGASCTAFGPTLSEGVCNQNAATTWGAVKWQITASEPGSCAANGGQPQGGVELLAPLTVCCLPTR